MFRNEDLPQGWEIKKLSELCDVRDGTHDSPKYKSEGYPLITSKNVTNGFIDFSEVNLISKEDYDKVNKRSYVDDGDILMPMIGTIGNPIIVKKEREFAIKNVALIKFTETDVSNKYIKLFLESINFKHYIKRINRGGTQKFISLRDIRNCPIVLSPLETQKKIVEILEKAEKLKEWRAEADGLSDNLLKSVYFNYFHGETNFKTLKEISEVITKGTTPTSLGFDYTTEGVPFIRAENILGGKINTNLIGKFIPKEANESLKRSKTKEGDVLLTIAGVIGRSSYIPSGVAECNLNQAVSIIRLKKGYNSKYVSAALESPFVQKQIKPLIKQVAQANLNLQQVGNLKIPINHEKEKEFLRFLKSYDNLKTHQSKSKQEIDNLFNTLMQKAFKGELVC